MTVEKDVATREAAMELLRQDPDVRILRRVVEPQPSPISPKAVGPIRRIGVVDLETTGLEVTRDEIIDLAIGIISVDGRGQIVGVGPGGAQLREPSQPIPPHISKLTGLTNADVAGHRLDVEKLAEFLDGADVLLSHNAAFDAPFLQALVPAVRDKAWACSCRDFHWQGHGFDGAKLGHLLMQAGWFSDGAHRAKADVLALVQLLRHELRDGTTVIGRILERAEKPTWRVEATGALFETRHILRSRGYRWDSSARVWWTEVDDRDEEIDWLTGKVLPGWRSPECREITWFSRYR